MINTFCARLSAFYSIGSHGLWAPLCLKLLSYRTSWIVRLCALPLMLAWLPAQAADFTFSGTQAPSGCSGSNGNYTCGVLTLGSKDTLIVAPGVVTTITINGNFSTGASSQINSAGNVLNLVVYGRTDTGTGSLVKANVTGIGTASVITIGADSSVVGTLKTDNAAINTGDGSTITGSIFITSDGAITVGSNATVTGSLNTVTGAINVGTGSKVGPITSSNAGAVTLGASSVVNGAITTNTGAITTAAGSNVTGNVITQVGAVTIGGNVGGKINSLDLSTAGAVTVSAGGVISGAIVTGAGAVTMEANAQSGGIATKDGAITLGAGGTVNGSACTGNSGAITVGANAKVTGNVITQTAGAITIGADSTVTGAVIVKGAGARTIGAGASVGATENSVLCADVAVAKAIPPPASAPKVKSREWRYIFMR